MYIVLKWRFCVLVLLSLLLINFLSFGFASSVLVTSAEENVLASSLDLSAGLDKNLNRISDTAVTNASPIVRNARIKNIRGAS